MTVVSAEGRRPNRTFVHPGGRYGCHPLRTMRAPCSALRDFHDECSAGDAHVTISVPLTRVVLTWAHFCHGSSEDPELPPDSDADGKRASWPNRQFAHTVSIPGGIRSSERSIAHRMSIRPARRPARSFRAHSMSVGTVRTVWAADHATLGMGRASAYLASFIGRRTTGA